MGNGQPGIGANLSFTKFLFIVADRDDAATLGRIRTAGANITDNGGLVVGRFTPFDFLVANNAPQFAAGCVSGAFTYIGQPFTYATQPVFTVTARNAQGGTTRNYTGAWWKITTGAAGTLTPVTQAARYTAFAGTLDTTGLPAVGIVRTLIGPAAASLSATHFAAAFISAACAGSVLTLGIDANWISSPSMRS